jgi:hypothetical protein
MESVIKLLYQESYSEPFELFEQRQTVHLLSYRGWKVDQLE